MKLFYSIAIALAITASAAAQITITYDDYDQLATAKSVVSYHAQTSSAVNFDIGGTGPGQVWDFTGQSYSSDASGSNIVDPSETPYAAQFPDATLASYAYTSEGEGYSYMRLDQSGFYLLGVVGTAQGQNFTLKYNPAKPEMKFPGTLGSSWTYDGDPVTVGGVATQQTRAKNTIDAAGTLKLPGGDYPCLRMRAEEWQTTKVEYNGQVISEDVTYSVTYTFVTNDGVNASLIADTTSPLTGTISASGLSYTVFSDATSTPSLAATDDFALDAAYPNPLVSGAQTTVAWNLPVQTNVSVKLYDARGREVQSVFEGRQNPGVHTQSIETSGMSPGTYFVRMNADGRVLTRSIAIVR